MPTCNAVRAACLALMLCVWACDRATTSAPPSASASASAAAATDQLPPLELRDDTPKLLLTWVDDEGDFHVVQKVADVPAGNRAAVRVVVADREAGTGAHVYVADLRSKRQDGTYVVKSMPRGEWDEFGASRRKARLEALAPVQGSMSPDAGAGSAKGGAARQPGQGKTVVAVIYGAEWCGPCHHAAKYLRQRGVTVVEKDIEQSDAARAEMQKKLERAKLPPTASIPIIDVMGRLMVGFSASQLDRAIDAAKASQTL